jgi:hypothetical protein
MTDGGGGSSCVVPLWGELLGDGGAAGSSSRSDDPATVSISGSDDHALDPTIPLGTGTTSTGSGELVGRHLILTLPLLWGRKWREERRENV